MTALEAIQTRRSIRSFNDTPVGRHLIEQVLQAALPAPSAKNSQPWRFTVVTEPKRDEMLAVIREGLSHREAEGQELGTIQWSLRCIEQAPVTVFVHNTDGTSTRGRLGRSRGRGGISPPCNRSAPPSRTCSLRPPSWAWARCRWPTCGKRIPS